MFTGIIQELGSTVAVSKNGESMQLTVAANLVISQIKLGDSIAVNGVCLTVKNFKQNTFMVDVMPETYHATSLVELKVGDKVNLEPALAVGERLGGHFVTGHVDGTAVITKIEANGNAFNYTLKINEKLIEYCLLKGSIAVDGTSLTIFALENSSVRLSLIPHTMKNTVLGAKKVGDLVNIECDMLGKYVIKNLRALTSCQSNGSAIDNKFLTEHGFN